MMNMEGSTRENVASHLQKYRLYLKRIEGFTNDGPSSSDQLFASTPVPQSIRRVKRDWSGNVFGSSVPYQHVTPNDKWNSQTLIDTVVIDESESSSGPKIKWAEVVGLTVEEAQNKIKEDMPMVQFQVVPPDHFVTMDYQPRRVRLYLDSSHKVARPPTIG